MPGDSVWEVEVVELPMTTAVLGKICGYCYCCGCCCCCCYTASVHHHTWITHFIDAMLT